MGVNGLRRLAKETNCIGTETLTQSRFPGSSSPRSLLPTHLPRQPPRFQHPVRALVFIHFPPKGLRVSLEAIREVAYTVSAGPRCFAIGGLEGGWWWVVRGPTAWSAGWSAHSEWSSVGDGSGGSGIDSLTSTPSLKLSSSPITLLVIGQRQ